MTKCTITGKTVAKADMMTNGRYSKAAFNRYQNYRGALNRLGLKFGIIDYRELMGYPAHVHKPRRSAPLRQSQITLAVQFMLVRKRLSKPQETKAKQFLDSRKVSYKRMKNIERVVRK